MAEEGGLGAGPALAEPPPPPQAAVDVFGDALGVATEFAGLLATEGVTRGLIGPGKPRACGIGTCSTARSSPSCCRIPASLSISAQAPGCQESSWRFSGRSLTWCCWSPCCDAWPSCRSAWSALGIENASVVRGRAEEYSGKVRADVVTARAVAPLDRLASWAAGLLRPDGEILAIKGESAAEEVAAARPLLSRLGARSTEILHVGRDKVIPATTVVRVVISGRGREEQAGAHRRRPGLA